MSTFCLMMASRLRYRCGRSVAVIDLNDPMHSIYEIRQLDMEAFREGGRHLMSFVPEDADPDRDWYPVITAETDVGEGDQRLMESLIRSMEGEYDYVIVDFGGSLGEGDTVVRFLMSTACWPQANIDALCPELESLFAEVLSLLEEDNNKDR